MFLSFITSKTIWSFYSSVWT